MTWPVGANINVMAAVAVILGLDDPATKREPVEFDSGEPLGFRSLGPEIGNGHTFV